MPNFKDVTVVLPSLNPDEKLTSTVKSIIDIGFEHIILLDDGSEEQYQKYFDECEAYPQVKVVHHDVNCGKGRALKTAFEYYVENCKGEGVVTADGDGQHTATDIKKCAEAMLAHGKVILGVRDFSLSDIPPRSRFGNRLTSFLFKTACGLTISDTQTGLRAIPVRYLDTFIKTSGERYEYETNMLLDFGKYQIPYAEEKIATVYIDDNSSSHFHPIRDSLRIYKQILGYILSSLGSFAIDNIIFFIAKLFINGVLSCTVIARTVSSFCNFMFNKKFVFENKSSKAKTALKYYALCIPQMLLSAGFVYLLTVLFGTESAWVTTLLKMAVDTVLFIFSYIIQKKWVFKNAS